METNNTKVPFPSSKIVAGMGEEYATTTNTGLNDDFLKTLTQHDNTHRVRLGMDYYDGKLWYGMTLGEKLFLLGSDKIYVEAKGRTAPLTPPLSTAGIQRYLKGDSVSGSELIARLAGC